MVSYEDVVRLLLKILTMTYEPNDNFIQYIIVSILNSLACQVDYSEKQMLGDLGAVQVIAHLCTGDMIPLYRLTHYMSSELV